MRIVHTVQNLLPGDCQLGVQAVYKVSAPTSREMSAGSEACYMVSKPTFRELSTGGAAYLYSFQTYLKGTVSFGSACLIQFQNVSAGDCRSEMQPVFTVSEPSSRRYSLFIRF